MLVRYETEYIALLKLVFQGKKFCHVSALA
jgi:hypothetical protein